MRSIKSCFTYLLTLINKTEINFVKKLQKEQYSTQRYTIVNICTM